MKATAMMKMLLLLLFSCQVYIAVAQVNKCGPYTIDKAAFTKALEYEAAHKGNAFTAAAPIVIRVYFRICQPDAGKLIDVNEAKIATDFKHLVGAYAADNICFVNAGYDYIQKSTLDTFNISNDDYHIFYPYGLQNCITVFYVDQLGGKNGSSGGGSSGVTYGVPSAWTIVRKDYIGKGTLEHEVGHCLGLLHTFDFKSGLEDIDGSNGSTSADLIADTKADPYVFAYLDTVGHCFASTNSGCTYSGTCPDPKLRTDYSPPYTNLMSYWCKGFYPTYTITAGQYTRVSSMLSTASALIPTESAQTVTESNINISAGYHMNSAVTTLSTSGTVIFSGNSTATLGAGKAVLLEPGFHAVPGIGGRVLIRHAFCDTTSNGYSFGGGGTQIGEDKPAEAEVQAAGRVNNILVYPNPATSSVMLTFNLNNNENKGVVGLYDINMRKIKEIPLGNNVQKGKHALAIDISKLSNGMYIILVQLPHTTLRTKLVVAK